MDDRVADNKIKMFKMAKLTLLFLFFCGLVVACK